ncbi:hypothetical protein ACQPT2_21835 [Erwinia amylovora]
MLDAFESQTPEYLLAGLLAQIAGGLHVTPEATGWWVTGMLRQLAKAPS